MSERKKLKMVGANASGIAAGFADGSPPVLDDWTLAHPARPHPPTAGVHENSWAEQSFCCGFAFVSDDLAPRVRDGAVDAQTQASDHQPVLLVLED